jgi:hypothetical protein
LAKFARLHVGFLRVVILMIGYPPSHRVQSGCLKAWGDCLTLRVLRITTRHLRVSEQLPAGTHGPQRGSPAPVGSSERSATTALARHLRLHASPDVLPERDQSGFVKQDAFPELRAFIGRQYLRAQAFNVLLVVAQRGGDDFCFASIDMRWLLDLKLTRAATPVHLSPLAQKQPSTFQSRVA